jgi:peptidoglycan/LPS O-acetylase OafA/YrhL
MSPGSAVPWPWVRAVPLLAPAPRMTSIDVVRIVAAVGIIWFHTQGAPYGAIGYAGLPVFLLCFLSLTAQRSHLYSTGCFLRRRWHRLLKPWLFWSGVYGTCRLAKAACAADPDALARLLSPETLLAGMCIHLWYLPYAFVAGLLIHLLNNRTAQIDDTRVVLAALFLGATALAACTVDTHGCRLMRPLPQWEFGLAAIPLGLAVGRALAHPSRRVRMRLLGLICGTTLAVCAALACLGRYSLPIPYGLGIVLVCLAHGWQVHPNRFVTAVAPLTFGIYLVHPLVMYGLKPLVALHGHYLGLIALTAAISAVLTWGLLKSPLKCVV